jgi:hypothetical protein
LKYNEESNDGLSSTPEEVDESNKSVASVSEEDKDLTKTSPPSSQQTDRTNEASPSTAENVEQLQASPSPSDESVEDSPEDENRLSPELASIQNTFSLQNQSTAKSIDTDDLVSVFLIPREVESGHARIIDQDGTRNIQQTEDYNRQIVTSLTSSSGMSDSLVGSDVDEEVGKNDTTLLESTSSEGEIEEGSPVEDSIDSFDREERATYLSEQFDYEEEEEQLGSFERNDFPHTPLDVIEEESQDDDYQTEDFESKCYNHPQRSADEDMDIFSLQQEAMMEDLLCSTDEYDIMELKEAKSRSNSPARYVNSSMKFVFTAVMIYHMGLITNYWDAEMIMTEYQRLQTDLVSKWETFTAQTTTPAVTYSSLLYDRFTSQSDHDDDLQTLEKLIEDALDDPTYYKPNTNHIGSIGEEAITGSTTTRSSWVQELESALEEDEIQEQLKAMMERQHNLVLDEQDIMRRQQEIVMQEEHMLSDLDRMLQLTTKMHQEQQQPPVEQEQKEPQEIQQDAPRKPTARKQTRSLWMY